MSGCGHYESVDHLFIYCPIFEALWQHVNGWIDAYLVDSQHIMDHFTQFAYSLGGFKSRRFFLRLTWLCTVWVLWNERNNRLFSNKAKSIMQFLDKVKMTILGWLKAKNVCFPFLVTTCRGNNPWFVWGLVDCLIFSSGFVIVLLLCSSVHTCARE